eukprot:jgi/Orpsp1_1/1175646/evm.model.c7180000054692.1
MSTSLFYNITFESNENINKNSCGTIYLKNNVKLEIDQSKFTSNISYSNGGVIYLENLNNLELNIKNSTFESNKAKNGGAIYISKNISEDNNKQQLNFENINFKNNNADFFGGAIYSMYDGLNYLTNDNIIFEENKAGVAGGAIFAPENPEKCLFDYSKCKFISNNALSHGDNYATNPYLIKLDNQSKIDNSIESGSYFPIEFSFYDQLDNLIIDPYKYYVDIIVKVSLEHQTIKNVPYKMVGNIGYFTKGYCKLNNLRIFVKSEYNTYKLLFNIENFGQHNVKFEQNNIELEVKSCKKHQITKKDINNFIYCESPICSPLCPVDDHAECYSFENNTYGINNEKLNICKCNNGWTGEYCDERIFVSFCKYNKIVIIVTTPSIILVILGLIHSFIYRNVKVIQDQGLQKNIFFQIGIMLYFISNLFSSHKNFGYCSLHLILKHAGIGLIYIILFIHIYSGIELGVKDSKDKKLKVISMNSDKDINEIYESLESLKIKRQSNIIESKPIELSVNSSRQNISFNEVMKNIKKTHYLYIEGLFLYTIFITITIIYITTKTFKYKSRNRLEQDNSGYWLYMCPSEKYELIVASYFSLSKMKANRTKYETLINYIGYLIIYLLYYWDKVYLINIAKCGDDIFSYFYFTSNVKCLVHNSYKCGCKLDETNENLEEITKKYINYYNICSTILTFKKGKLAYIKASTKTLYLSSNIASGKK